MPRRCVYIVTLTSVVKRRQLLTFNYWLSSPRLWRQLLTKLSSSMSFLSNRSGHLVPKWRHFYGMWPLGCFIWNERVAPQEITVKIQIVIVWFKLYLFEKLHKYSWTSVAWTLMARLPCLTRTHSWVPMIPYMRLLWSVFMLLFSFSVLSDRRSLKIGNENNSTKILTAQAPYI